MQKPYTQTGKFTPHNTVKEPSILYVWTEEQLSPLVSVCCFRAANRFGCTLVRNPDYVLIYHEKQYYLVVVLGINHFEGYLRQYFNTFDAYQFLLRFEKKTLHQCNIIYTEALLQIVVCVFHGCLGSECEERSIGELFFRDRHPDIFNSTPHLFPLLIFLVPEINKMCWKSISEKRTKDTTEKMILPIVTDWERPDIIFSSPLPALNILE